MQTLLLFDIGSNRLRLRVERACRDVGMQRIQFSAFLGELDRAHLDRLRGRLEKEIADYVAAEKEDDVSQALLLHILPIDEGSFGKAQRLNREGTGPCPPCRWPALLFV